MASSNGRGYWMAVLGVFTKIMASWFLASFIAGFLFADLLDNIRFGDHPLGFWFAHEGSIYIFIAVVCYFAKEIDDINRRQGSPYH